ncbi:hypothetical protein XANMN_19730 [Xanthomonas phaseoli pv. manihotis str. CIO151]|nr:hypothetical protein XANMN_19730 [Xanthomonas phaseoli pv. manihotis str. CIO151]
MALQKGQRLREAGQFEVAAVGQIKSAGDIIRASGLHRSQHHPYRVLGEEGGLWLTTRIKRVRHHLQQFGLVRSVIAIRTLDQRSPIARSS